MKPKLKLDKHKIIPNTNPTHGCVMTMRVNSGEYKSFEFVNYSLETELRSTRYINTNDINKIHLFGVTDDTLLNYCSSDQYNLGSKHNIEIVTYKENTPISRLNLYGGFLMYWVTDNLNNSLSFTFGLDHYNIIFY